MLPNMSSNIYLHCAIEENPTLPDWLPIAGSLRIYRSVCCKIERILIFSKVFTVLNTLYYFCHYG